jgi:hypothetical protein
MATARSTVSFHQRLPWHGLLVDTLGAGLDPSQDTNQWRDVWVFVQSLVRDINFRLARHPSGMDIARHTNARESSHRCWISTTHHETRVWNALSFWWITTLRLNMSNAAFTLN